VALDFADQQRMFSRVIVVERAQVFLLENKFAEINHMLWGEDVSGCFRDKS
jgi:hypothetical protein